MSASSARRSGEWTVADIAAAEYPGSAGALPGLPTGERGRHRRGDPSAAGRAGPARQRGGSGLPPASAPRDAVGSTGWPGVDTAAGWRTDTGAFGDRWREPTARSAPPGGATSRERRPDSGATPDWEWWTDTGTGEWPATGWTRADRAPAQWTGDRGRDRRDDPARPGLGSNWRADTVSAAGRDLRSDPSAPRTGSDRRTDTDAAWGGTDCYRTSGAADWRRDPPTTGARDWRTDTDAGRGGTDWRTDTGTGRDWRTDTGTGEWPTSEWTRVGRAAPEHRLGDDDRPGHGLHRVGSARPVAPPAALPRLLAAVRPDGRPVALDEHLRGYGALPALDRRGPDERVLRLVAASRLRGRGGAGFPVEAKMRAVLGSRGRPVVVVNGAAGDPLTEKDAFLLARLPHLVLDGAQVAAAAVDARQVLLYVVARPQVYGAVERAMAERRRARLDAVPVKLVPAPDRYIAGESSAVAHHLSGGPALPTFQPPHAAERGVKGRPTLVHNVETLANLALLARYGSDWFRGIGTPDEPGSLVVTVRGAVPRPVVIEVPVGTTVEQALAGAGWLTEAVGAVQVGGCFGRWLPVATALSAPLSHAGMLGVGGTLGAGVVIALPDRACGLGETARLARYLAGESAGQCGACVNGLPAIAGALTALAESTADGSTVQRLYRWCGMVAGRGACRHPDGVAGLVASALSVFAEDVGRHLAGWCGRSLRGVLPVPPAAPPPRPRVTT